MEFFTLLVVGLLTGLVAGLFVGGVGYGLLSDILIGGVGSFLGRWLLGALGVGVPLGSIGGTILLGFSGALAILLLLRMEHTARRTRDRWTRSPSSSSPWRP